MMETKRIYARMRRQLPDVVLICSHCSKAFTKSGRRYRQLTLARPDHPFFCSRQCNGLSKVVTQDHRRQTQARLSREYRARNPEIAKASQATKRAKPDFLPKRRVQVAKAKYGDFADAARTLYDLELLLRTTNH